MVPLLKLTCWLSCGIHLTVLTSAGQLVALNAVQESQKSVIHTVVPTECNPYQDWQVGFTAAPLLGCAQYAILFSYSMCTYAGARLVLVLDKDW